MEKLNYLTMLTALRDCTETDGFRVGIFATRQARVLGIFDELIKSMDDEERNAKSRSVRTANSTFIEFKNGSYLKVLGAKESARGNVFHRVLYEAGINEEILNCVIRYTERLKSPLF